MSLLGVFAFLNQKVSNNLVSRSSLSFSSFSPLISHLNRPLLLFVLSQSNGPTQSVVPSRWTLSSCSLRFSFLDSPLDSQTHALSFLLLRCCRDTLNAAMGVAPCGEGSVISRVNYPLSESNRTETKKQRRGRGRAGTR